MHAYNKNATKGMVLSGILTTNRKKRKYKKLRLKCYIVRMLFVSRIINRDRIAGTSTCAYVNKNYEVNDNGNECKNEFVRLA